MVALRSDTADAIASLHFDRAHSRALGGVQVIGKVF
ncbi:hypothetical protein BJQ90_03337 [Arthrobacter sp. SO3]|nr:hypothetical protein [Arthrobacter sp. SO3]